MATVLADGRAQVSGTTVGGERRAIGSCGGIDGSEVLYAFTLDGTIPVGADILVTVKPRDMAFQPVVYLRQGRCDSPQAELQRACVAAHQPGAIVQLHTRNLSPSSGTYYVVVDGLAATGGAFELDIEVGGRAGRNCSDVLPLSGRRFTVRSAYTNADDSFTPGCGRAGGADRVYRLETDESAYLRARVEDEQGAYSTVVAVADVCGSREQACSSLPDSVLLPAGTHYLWVDRYLQSIDSQGYILRGELSAPLPGDTCALARPLSFPGGAQGGTASDTVAVAGLHRDGDWSCNSSDGVDMAYSFTTDRILAFHGRATDSKGRSLALTVVGAACTPEARVACGASNLDITHLPAGSYFLWVDGIAEDSGNVSLTASLDPPP
jgi:hypothetical protein